METAHLTDFGLAKAIATGSKYTRTGQALGTPAYMSPEQARGEVAALTPATDVWALGCVLHELLTGRPAFDGDTPAATIGAVLTSDPEPPAGVPAHVRTLLRACLDKSPARRPPDARRLADDCGRVLAGVAPIYRGTRRRVPATLAALGVLLAVLGTAGALWLGRATPGDTAGERAAARLAESGWSLRAADPSRGAALLGQALAAAPDRHEWRLRHGLLLWATARNEIARREWSAIPATASEWPTARLYIALETLFRQLGAGGSLLEAVPDARAAALAPGRTGVLGAATLACVTGDRARGLTLLAGLPGWEAALLRALCLQSRPDDVRRECLRAYDEALADGVAFAWVYTNRAEYRAELGDLAGAIADCDAALAIAPRDVRSFLARSQKQRALGHLSAALADAEAALAVDPRSAAALNARGLVRDAREDFAGAIADYTAALAIDPQFADALNHRGLARTSSGDPAGACADYDLALLIAPRDLHARVNRAHARFLCGDPAGALADCEMVLAAAPRHVMALVARGSLRVEAGDLAGGIADFDAALAERPGEPISLRNRGRARALRGDHAGARADFDAAIEAAPRDAEARRQRATVRHAAGDLAGALADLDATLVLDPRQFVALHDRGVLKAASGDHAGAIADYTTALALDPREPSALANRGLAFGDLGRFAEAAADLARALELAPADWPRRDSVARSLAAARAELARAGG